MSSPDERRLAELAAAIDEIRLRLNRLEERAGVAAPPAKPAPPPPTAAAAPATQPRTLEARMGLTWVNRIGVITLVLGAAFFFKYAVDSGWIAAGTRVLLGVAVGCAALGMAERTWRSGQRVYSQGICGAGIGILYLAFYAAFSLYGLIPQAGAFALVVLVTAASGALSLRYGSAAIAALGLIGGALAPPLLLGTEEHRSFVLGYGFVLAAGAVLIARRRRWRSLPALALAAAILLFASGIRPENRLADTVFTLSCYALFASNSGPAIFASAQLAAGIAIAAVWEDGLGAYLAIAMGLTVSGLARARSAERGSGALAVLSSFWISYGIWHSGQSAHPLWIVFGYLTAGFLLFLTTEMRRAAGFWLQALNAGIYFGSAYALLRPEHINVAGPFALVLASLYAALAYRSGTRGNRRAAVFCSGIAWTFLVLAAPIQFTSYRVTMAWAAEAAALAWIGVRFAERRALRASLALFSIALLRLCFVDSRQYVAPESYSAIVNERFLAFLVAVVCLWGAARWIGRGWMALTTYVAGHAALLWALCLEVLAWAVRMSPPETLRNVRSTAVSILLAGYALALVSLGVATRTAINRVLGLALIAFVIAKLYLYDVWHLQLFYRMAAFAVLGALLLAMSYLYSRFRAGLEKWWKPRSQRLGN